MWTVEPKQIWAKPRAPGISGFMRLKNEAEFLDRAIETHIGGLDELIIVHNDCSDETPEICLRWARAHPDKIKVVEYGPKVVPSGTPESLTIDPRSPNCIANYYNYALSLTTRKIVIKIDGDHLAVPRRFNRICGWVRRRLKPNQRYPIYGLNITQDDRGQIVIYNYYDFAPQFAGARTAKKGPPPFTSGDHAFYYVDERSWHTVDPVEGFEVMNLSAKVRCPNAALTYAFFHLKGMKRDRGISNWGVDTDSGHLRAAWASNVLAPDPDNLTSIEVMRHYHPPYFRGANFQHDLRAALPNIPVRVADENHIPRIGLRERAADLWCRFAFL